MILPVKQYWPILAVLLWSCVLAGAFSQGAITPPSAFNINSDCQLWVNPRHISTLCVDASSAETFPEPIIEKSCARASLELLNTKQYPLGCQQEGWIDYFTPANWEVYKINGDGGVDVTGAPNALLVEGANKALIQIDPLSELQFQIVIPAEGYINFEWDNVGGSNLYLEVWVNGQLRSRKHAGPNPFFSPLLRTGDLLALRFIQEQEQAVEVAINRFRFITNSVGVKVKNWALNTDTEQRTFRQMITFERANLANITFPANRSGQTLQKEEEKQLLSPQKLGYPFIDQDGNPYTEEDQIFIDNSFYQLELSWEDEFQKTADGYQLLRHWTINDQCAGNYLQETQVINLYDRPDLVPKGQQKTLSSGTNDSATVSVD